MGETYYTISQFGRQYDLSRSTLLYYHEIGLLTPAFRTGSGYRMYGKHEKLRMDRINTYRKTGLSLEVIAEILDGGSRKLTAILDDRLSDLNREIGKLRLQQRVIMDLLKSRKRKGQAFVVNKEGWIAIMQSAGMDDNDMKNWHIQFERQNPVGHRNFLVSLGIEDKEIETVRCWSR